MKKQPKEPKKQETPGEGRSVGVEVYLAPPPPSKGRIIGLDCHPDTFTAAVFRGTTPHDAHQLECRVDMSLQKLLEWAAKEFTHDDIFLMEAGSNSFEIHRRLLDLKLRAVVLESCHVGRNAKSYADNDKMAAARIVRVYLAGDAPCVWTPDPVTCERRELLHAWNRAVAARTAAVNSLKGYLNQFAIRPGKRSLESAKTEAWILSQRVWTPMQKEILNGYLGHLRYQTERRKTLLRIIGREICREPLMLRCMTLLGIGTINAFALLAVIGDVRRFERPEKLAAYLGLNPGQRESGRGKKIKVGVGKRGRGDMRSLLIQAAQCVLRIGKNTALGKWGWKLFARKGQRNIAIVAVARKLAVQVWHLLAGNPPEALEPDKSLKSKLERFTVEMGKSLREQIELPGSVKDCALHLYGILTSSPIKITANAQKT